MITVSDIKEVYGKSASNVTAAVENLKEKLDKILAYEDWEVDEVIEHDYSLIISNTNYMLIMCLSFAFPRKV